MVFFGRSVLQVALLLILTVLASCQGASAPESEMSESNTKALIDKINGLHSGVTCEALDALTATVAKAEGIPDFHQRKLRAQQAVCSLTPETEMNTSAYETAVTDGIWADLSGRILTLYAKSTTESEPQLCCAIQKAVWASVGEPEDKIWTARLRLKEADGAKLMFMDTSGTDPDFNSRLVQGKQAEIVEVPFLGDPAIRLSGTFEQRQLASPELGETRTLSIYQARGAYDPTTPVMLLADGISLGYYARMIDPMIEQGLIKPVNFIGIHSGRDSISETQQDLPEDPRASDYLPGYKKGLPDRFDNHMRFLFETALPTIFPAEGRERKIAVGGHSNGAVFAVHAGAENQDRVDAVLSVSGGFGGMKTSPECAGDGVTFYLSAGLYEPSFLASTEVTEQTLKAKECHVVTTYHPVGHDNEFYKTELYRFLLAEFGPTQK